MAVYKRKGLSLKAKNELLRQTPILINICNGLSLNQRMYNIQEKLAKDPVCGMQIDGVSAVNSKVDGTVFYFCCPNCKARFDRDPSKFMR